MLLDIFVDEFSTISNIFLSRKNYSLHLSKKLFSIIKKKSVINNNINTICNLHKKRQFFINIIIKTRKNCIIKIQCQIRRFLIYKKIKSFKIIKYIIKQRIKSIKLIQSKIRMIICRNDIKELLNNDALFFYKFPNELLDKIFLNSNINDLKKQLQNNKLNISMIIQKPKMNLDFKYNKYLNSYYISIKKIKLMRKIILVNFKVNNEIFIDPRYSITDDKEGNFYNVLTSKMFHRKRKEKNLFQNIKKEIKKEEEKHWEELFMLKSRKRLMSFDASSISSKTDISKELDKNLGETFCNQVITSNNNDNDKKPLQSILKRKNNKNEKISFGKRVSFNKKIEFCE